MNDERLNEHDIVEPLMEDDDEADGKFDLLQADVERVDQKKTAHHSLIDKKYLMTPGNSKRMIDRETILPSRKVEEKADKLLVEESAPGNGKTCWGSFVGCLCPFGKGKKVCCLSLDKHF
jgi:hypothetical protein